MTTYKEELVEGRIKHEQEVMLNTLKEDNEFIEEVCEQIGQLFRSEYVEKQKDVVTFYLLPRSVAAYYILSSTDIVKNGQIIDYETFHVNNGDEHIDIFLPQHLLLELRYQLAKKFGLVFTQEITREKVLAESKVKKDFFAIISFNKITLKLK